MLAMTDLVLEMYSGTRFPLFFHFLLPKMRSNGIGFTAVAYCLFPLGLLAFVL